MYVHIRIILHKYRVLAKISKKKLINFIRLVEANIRQNMYLTPCLLCKISADSPGGLV
jgi:E3 ubiquitin-protein ligase DOA10